MQLCQLVRAIYFLVLNLRIIPLEIVKVVAPSFQDWIGECITVTIFIWILRINHPSSTCCKSRSLLWLSF
jgi:hypothetical protein